MVFAVVFVFVVSLESNTIICTDLMGCELIALHIDKLWKMAIIFRMKSLDFNYVNYKINNTLFNA